MPRGIYDRRKRRSVVKVNIKADSTSLIPTASFASIKGWDELNPKEQGEVVDQGQQLVQAMVRFGLSRLEIGERLSKIRVILEPHGMFDEFLRKSFRFKSARTAYRYIAGFENAKSMLPEPVLKAAMARGYNIIGDSEKRPLGEYTEAVAAIPVPSSITTTEQADAYLDKVDQARKQKRINAVSGNGKSNVAIMGAEIIPQDPKTMLKECYRFVSARYRKLPNNHKTRQSWVSSLVGMMLAELGVSNTQTFTPMAPPEDFRASRGRPRLAA